MSRDQRVTAASAPSQSPTSLHAHPGARLVTAQYRWARLSVLLALLLLAGTAVYLVAQERQQTWRAARESVLNLALDLETSITGVLEQSAFSLRGIAADVGRRPGIVLGSEQAMAVLREAARFDPISSYLGLRTADGRVLAVGRSGEPLVSPDALRTIARGLEPRRTGLDVSYLIRLAAPDEWYLPITLDFRGGSDAREVAFALVPARRLIASTDSLRLIPDSFVSLVAPDGRLLVSYAPGSGSFNALHRHARQPLEQAGDRRSGVFLSLPAKDRFVGFARSAALPVYVRVSVSTASLRREWLAAAAAPAAVLVIGVFAVIVFGLQLHRALRRQAAYIAEQEYLAQHDTLTGLKNRDGFMRELEQAISASPEDPLAVLLLDLNRFKEINDTLGHAAGDHVLREIGERLRERFCHSGTCIARLGGDELAILARGAEAARTLESLGARVQECLGRITLPGGVELDLTASIGAAVFPQDVRTPSELLRCADIAMYAAKEDLSAFCRYHEAMDQFTPEMLALQSELGKSLREGSLSVAYQPKVRLADGELIGLEALARWPHPTMGLIAPSRFMPLADGTELVHSFAQYMLQAVCGQIVTWQRGGYRVPISMNISANNLLDRGFADKVRAILDSLAVEPELLELEVTESAVMRHPDTMLKRLNEIRALGVRLAIDDFGTGYASLAYLKRLPVHTLKIDRSFVTNLTEDVADQRIVRSSIQLAHSFGMAVVAEGVEAAGTAWELHAYGCEFAQGYYFGHPQTAEEIEARWLETASVTSHLRAG
ncbi:MAG TPA: EAL domain-containing protein [Steroidobacteraceae bacterium]|nr:EAL domain-containing protein [Steroidobacteraceae bacterium]